MRLLGWLLVRIPRSWLAAFGAALGALLWALRIRRRVVLDNLRLAFPEKTEAERRDIARQDLPEPRPDDPGLPARAVPPARGARADLRVRGLGDHGGGARQRRGVIACTAHFGNFDLLAAAHTLRGMPVTMISRQMGKSGANDLWRASGGAPASRTSSSRRARRSPRPSASVKAGRVLGYVIDQNQPRRHAIFPTFFGVPAATAPTPAVLALRSGAAVIFALSVPLGDGRHKVIIEGPLAPAATPATATPTCSRSCRT